MIAARQVAQALPGLVEQLGLGQDAAADRDHRVGREDEGALELVIHPHGRERGLGLGAREPVGAGARQLALDRGLVDVRRAQLVGLDARLIDQGEAARRAGGEHDLGTADHRGGLVSEGGIARNVADGLRVYNRGGVVRMERSGMQGSRPRIKAPTRLYPGYSFATGGAPKRSLMRASSMSRTCR